MRSRRPSSVSVVVPARDAAATVEEQLTALRSQRTDVPFDVVVVDNGSTDGTTDVVRRVAASDPRFRLIRADERPGVNHARNAGIAATEGELLLFCDADDVVADGWIAAMVDAAASADVIGGVLETGRLNSDEARSARPEPHPPGSLPAQLGFLPYAIGANFGVWRTVAEAVGGFPPTPLPGGDDMEFCWRVQLAGGRLALAPGSVVHYRYRPPVEAARQAYRYGQAEPALYRQFRAAGMPRAPIRGAVKSLLMLLADLPAAGRSPETRRLWRWRMAHKLGRYRGCLRYRVMFP